MDEPVFIGLICDYLSVALLVRCTTLSKTWKNVCRQHRYWYKHQQRILTKIPRLVPYFDGVKPAFLWQVFAQKILAVRNHSFIRRQENVLLLEAMFSYRGTYFDPNVHLEYVVQDEEEYPFFLYGQYNVIADGQRSMAIGICADQIVFGRYRPRMEDVLSLDNLSDEFLKFVAGAGRQKHGIRRFFKRLKGPNK